jgi:hypothetical protein
MVWALGRIFDHEKPAFKGGLLVSTAMTEPRLA